MLDITIVHHTASTFKFKIRQEITFSKAQFWMDAPGMSSDVLVDEFVNGESTHSVLKIDTVSGELSVDMNMMPLDTIYYKSYYVVFLDDNDVEVGRTKKFTISPQGKQHLYGIINKLEFEFTRMAKFSGTTIRLFIERPTADRCPECWDFELNQRISSTCSCSSSAYDTQDILCRKVKTESKQIYTDKGTVLAETAIFQTYERADFVKGIIFADLTDKQFYSVLDRKIANIGGVRTSTLFTGQLIKPNDSRVTQLVNMV